MTIDAGLSHGQVINNDQLCAVFKCSTQGGMRRSLTTNSLVLVSNHVASIYDDRWIGDTFHYTGMGQQGDQSLSSAQNKTPLQSREPTVWRCISLRSTVSVNTATKVRSS